MWARRMGRGGRRRSGSFELDNGLNGSLMFYEGDVNEQKVVSASRLSEICIRVYTLVLYMRSKHLLRRLLLRCTFVLALHRLLILRQPHLLHNPILPRLIIPLTTAG